MSSRRLAPLAALAVAAATLLASQLPHVWAVYATARGYAEGKGYAQVAATSAVDAFSYYGWMRQGAEGRFAFVDRYAVEDHPRLYVNVFYGALGRIAGMSGASIPAVYAIARLVLGAVLLGAIWWFAGRCFDRAGPRLACFALASVSGGWEGPYNWFVRHHGWEPLSSPGWWMPELSTFFSVMTIPHFAAAFTLQLLAVGWMADAWTDAGPRGRRRAIGAGLCLLGLAFFHPYEVVTCAAMCAAYPLLRAVLERRLPWGDVARAAIPMAIVAPAIAWNAWLFSRNPAFRAMDEQAVMTTPGPAQLAIALGAGGILAVAALAALGRMTVAQRVAAAWFLASLGAAHAPLRFQRRMLGGIQYPIAVLATFALTVWVVPWLSRRLGGRRLLAVASVFVLMAPLQGATPRYVQDLEWNEIRKLRAPVWIPASERELLREIDREAQPGASVFAAYDFGMLVPGFSGARTYLGHYSLTIDSAGKGRDVARFFDPATADGWRRELLERHGIDFVAWTRHERAVGAFEPGSAPWLEEVARFGDGGDLAVLYRVALPASMSPSP